MSQSNGQRPPAGWFHDPGGSQSLRWWDGTAWTNFRKPYGPPDAPPDGVAIGAAGGPGGLVRAPAAAPMVVNGESYASVAGIWNYTMSMLAPQPVVKRSAFRAYPRGYGPTELTGKTVADIASAWGRPDWWAPEAATGGVIAGWSLAPDMAVHLTSGGVCDRVLRMQVNELDLSWRLRCLGNVLGRPKEEVINFLGEPNARSGIGGGLLLLQWVRPGYHIALKFGDDGACLGITSQHAASPMSL